jgi:polyisoprenoid-binding protein YceI
LRPAQFVYAGAKKIQMKKYMLFTLAALISSSVAAQYKPVEQSSSVNFTIKNLGFGVDGTFKGLQGDIAFDPANLATSVFDVTLDASTVNTDNSLRDGHLKGDSYFDVKNYPRILFVSTKVSAGKSGAYLMTGKLTIKKTTKVISFPFSATSSNAGFVFKGTFSINRKDYDVGGTSTISDNLDVSLNILAKKT